MSLTLSEPEEMELVNLLGYIHGGDIALNDQLVILSAHYDTLPAESNGAYYAGVNDNGSGIAVGDYDGDDLPELELVASHEALEVCRRDLERWSGGGLCRRCTWARWRGQGFESCRQVAVGDAHS